MNLLQILITFTATEIYNSCVFVQHSNNKLTEDDCLLECCAVLSDRN
jgi:hypothetical protein